MTGYRFHPYTEQWEQAAARFNTRLRASGKAPFFLPEQATGSISEETALQRQHHLAIDDADEVRGSCLFQPHQGWVDHNVAPVLNIQSPLSEGLYEMKYAGVGPWMLREAVRRYPFTYCVGIGGENLPFARLLRALRWRVEPVPFYFHVLDGRKFLSNMQPLRNHPKLGKLAILGSGVPVLPSLAFSLAHWWKAALQEPRPLEYGPVDWKTVRARYAFGVDRSEASLDVLYAPTDNSFRRIQIPGGFGLIRVNQFTGHRYFGNLRIATLIEALCESGAVRQLLRAVVNEAKQSRAGLLVTNQSSPELQAGLREEGWLSFTSNYLVGLSPPLTQQIKDRPFYVNRGDGDGLLNL